MSRMPRGAFDQIRELQGLPLAAMGRQSAVALVAPLEDGAPLVSVCLQGRIIERESTRALAR